MAPTIQPNKAFTQGQPMARETVDTNNGKGYTTEQARKIIAAAQAKDCNACDYFTRMPDKPWGIWMIVRAERPTG